MIDVTEVEKEMAQDVGSVPDDESAAKITPPKKSIPAYAQFHLKDVESTRYPIFIRYVRDQNGTVLGFKYFNTEKEEDLEMADMLFYLTPETTSLTTYTLYRMPEEQEEKEPSDNTGDDGSTETETLEEQILFVMVFSIMRRRPGKMFMLRTLSNDS